MPLLVAPLKSSAVFLADLSRALAIDHELDVIELAPYGSGRPAAACGCSRISTGRSTGRDVLLVEDVVDTGLTLGFLTRSFAERRPASLAAVTLLDRPYRRLVDDIPLRHVGFTVPDELFAGYGLGLDERWRALPGSPRRRRRRALPRGRRRDAALSCGEASAAAASAITGSRAGRPALPLTRTSKWTCGPGRVAGVARSRRSTSPAATAWPTETARDELCA